VTKAEEHRVSLSILPGSYNVIREPLHVVACWRLGDGAFGFDDTFIGSGARKDFREFAEVWRKHPSAKVALFGHTDIAGKEKYNHGLGAGRARAVYGVLRNDPDIWCEMYQDDADALASVKKRLRASGHSIPKDEKGLGEATRAAIRTHIGRLAGELALDPTDFLGEHGQYSMQSCSEYNALRRISSELDKTLDATQRDAFERANRRVLAFLFAPGTHVDGRWPCPRPGDGVEGCKPRFWSDAPARRAISTVARQFVPDGVSGGPLYPVVEAKDTFACRFYDRIAHKSPCERAEPWIPPEEVIIIEEEDDTGGTDPVVPELEQVVLTCAHPNRHNSGYLRKSASTDRIEIVPEDEEIVTARTEPRASAVWTLPGEGPIVGEKVLVPIGQVVPTTDLGFFELKNVSPEIHVITAVHGSKAQTLEIHAYPFDPYEDNFDDVLDAIRKAFWLQIKAWSIIGEVLPSVDHIEIELLDPAKCHSLVYGGWLESPVESGTGRDYRAFFSYDVALKGKPLLAVDAGMEASLGNLLKKTKIDTKKLPGWLQRVLKLAKLSGTLVGKIDGPIGAARPSIDKTEVFPGEGELVYRGQFKIAPKSLLDFEIFEDLHGSIELEFTVRARLSLRVEASEVVIALDGRVEGSRFSIVVGDETLVEFEPFEGWDLDEISVSIPLPTSST